MPTTSRFGIALLVVWTATLAGCGGGIGTVPAGGVVTWNGKPVAKAELTFLRQDDKGPASIAITGPDGRFQLRTGKYDGVLPGKYKVVVQKSSVAEMNLPDPLPNHMGLSEYLQANNIIAYPLLPLSYGNMAQTPLDLEVTKDGLNEFDLQLQGSPPPRPAAKKSQQSPFG